MHRAWLWLGAALALALNVGCASLGSRPEVRDVRMRITGIDLQGVDLALDVDVHNPYLFALRTPSFRYGLDIEDAAFIESASDTRVDLPANDVGTATLPLRVGYAALWKTYSRLSDSAEVSYRLRATLLLKALGQSFELPVSHGGTFPVLRLPEFRVGDVDVSDLSLSRARVAVAAELRNPNVFEIDAQSLGYALTLGETEVGEVVTSTLGAVGAGQTGTLTLSGEIVARNALAQLLRGQGLGTPRLSPTGTLKTPYGSVELPR